MSTYVGAIDQGTTSSRFMVFDQQGAVVAVAQREHEQIYPKPGWVEHDAAEIWRNTEAVIGEALAKGGVRRRRACGRRHHQSARDDGAVGPQHRRAAAQCARLAGHANGRSRRGVRARRRPGPVSRAHGLTARDLFQRAEAALVARQRAGRAREGRRRRRLVRNDRYVAPVESHGRLRGRRALDRRDECEPHAADRLADARLGRRHARRVRGATGAPAAHRAVERQLWHGRDRCAARRADLGNSRRSASGPRRSNVLRARRGEEHVRHGLFHADEHGAAGRAVDGAA